MRYKKVPFQIELSITKSIDQKFLFFLNSRRIYDDMHIQCGSWELCQARTAIMRGNRRKNAAIIIISWNHNCHKSLIKSPKNHRIYKSLHPLLWDQQGGGQTYKFWVLNFHNTIVHCFKICSSTIIIICSASHLSYV